MVACTAQSAKKIMKKNLDLDSYIGKNYLQVEEEIKNSGLYVYSCPDAGGKEITPEIERNIDIRYDKTNNNITRIWQTE